MQFQYSLTCRHILFVLFSYVKTHILSMSLIKYVKGDLFQVTTNRTSLNEPILIAHACNCLGHWGAGVALVFKKKFPSAFEMYKNHCSQFKDYPSKLLGTTLLIPISNSDGGFVDGVGRKVIIVCLFTSIMGGDGPTAIATYT